MTLCQWDRPMACHLHSCCPPVTLPLFRCVTNWRKKGETTRFPLPIYNNLQKLNHAFTPPPYTPPPCVTSSPISGIYEEGPSCA
jgi:hypothetical protein